MTSVPLGAMPGPLGVTSAELPPPKCPLGRQQRAPHQFGEAGGTGAGARGQQQRAPQQIGEAGGTGAGSTMEACQSGGSQSPRPNPQRGRGRAMRKRNPGEISRSAPDGGVRAQTRCKAGWPLRLRGRRVSLGERRTGQGRVSSRGGTTMTASVGSVPVEGRREPLSALSLCMSEDSFLWATCPWRIDDCGTSREASGAQAMHGSAGEGHPIIGESD